MESWTSSTPLETNMGVDAALSSRGAHGPPQEEYDVTIPLLTCCLQAPCHVLPPYARARVRLAAHQTTFSLSQLASCLRAWQVVAYCVLLPVLISHSLRLDAQLM